MTLHYSDPFESLLGGDPKVAVTAQVVIVGSGYGGAVAAYRLAELAPRDDRRFKVLVLERGREYALGEFPTGLDELPAHLRIQRGDRPQVRGNHDALFDLRLGDNVDVLVGSGLGGTSLINANVALEPEPAVFREPHWPAALRAEAQDFGSSPLAHAFEGVRRMLDLQRITPRNAPTKHEALRRYARRLGLSVEAAPIAVNLESRRSNAAGVTQEPCTGCGNCVTGCNVGAKGTLAMNFIPAAKSRGVTFCTGARVLAVQPLPDEEGAPRWIVRVRATSSETQAHWPDDLEIRADLVILAAGTLGSTEILQRSQAQNGLSLSPRLGHRFSTNGDALAMSFAGNEPVDALGAALYDRPHDCGPTITAVAHGDLGGTSGRFVLEDAAVPFGIRELFGEIVTTAAQVGRIGHNRLPGWLRRHADRDPLAVHDEALARSQVFLVMSRDDARGQLVFRGDALLDEVPTVPTWSEVGGEDGTRLDDLDRRLKAHDRKAGLDEAQFVANPLWRPLPETLSAMFGQARVGRLLTVHPLGGCAMADDGAHGVVNDRGQVFAGDGSALHPGLYVMDGAIVPGSLGVNPFLTIAALAWRACDALLPGQAAPTPQCAAVLQAPMHPKATDVTVPRAAPLVVRERLMGTFEAPDAATLARLQRAYPDCGRWFQQDGLFLELETEAADSDLTVSGAGPVRVTARLYQNPIDAERVDRNRIYGMPRERRLGAPLALGQGTLTLMALDRAAPVEHAARTLGAFRAYLARRQPLRDLLKGAGPGLGLRKALSMIRVFANVAAMQAAYREFRYELTFDRRPGRADAGPTTPLPHAIALTGTKRIGWRRDNDRLWQALLRLPVRLRIDGLGVNTAGTFDVDAGYLVSDGLLRVDPGPGTSVPYGIVEAGRFTARFARSIVQAGFWEFGAPDYPREPLQPQPAPPATIDTRLRLRERIEYRVPRALGDARELPQVLHDYGRETGRPPVLLIHGLAQGSLIYAHPSHPLSMAEYLDAAGFDVWLLDHRLSNRFDATQVPYDGWTIDDIAAIDIPEALRRVGSRYPAGTRVHVFAHCVGAVACAMAILDGRISQAQIASLALNAIHPWILPSPANDFRARLGVFVRDYLTDAFFEPIPAAQGRVSALHALLDRIAFSLARLGEHEGEHPFGPDPGLARAICDRMTFLYGRMWRHRNTVALHPYWKDLVGRAPGAVQRHLFYLLTNRRVLTHDGDNAYLTEANVARWAGIRTLFVHGDRSDVFNPQSATRSAVRLRRALAQGAVPLPPIRLKRIPGYGHMDVILADEAPRDSFPYLASFFRGDFDHAETTTLPDGRELQTDPVREGEDPHAAARLMPNIGPVLRGARMNGGRLQLRVWAEMPTMTTTVIRGARIVEPASANLIGGEPLRDEQYYWIDLELDPAEYGQLVLQGNPATGSLATSGLELRRTGAGEEEGRRAPAWLERLQARATGHSPRDCHFLVGSCRYPGLAFDRAAADDVFGLMRRHLARPEPCDALFLIGDQIYADASAGLFGPQSWRDRYEGSYREAFGARHLREVLRTLPVHFAVDDHEIADNFAGPIPPRPGQAYQPWREDRVTERMKAGLLVRDPAGSQGSEYDFALRVGERYQGSARATRSFGPGVGPAGRFWYALEHGNEFPCPAFVLDTRSERRRATTGVPARLMEDRQLQALIAWLTQAQHERPREPKFIFSGSVIAPLQRDAHRPGMSLREDGLVAYPRELEQIVAHIVSNGIERVVFVGGDLHLSCACRLTLSDSSGRSVDGLQIVASGLYAPLPFANLSPRDIDWDRHCRIALGQHAVDYNAQLLSTARAHFVSVAAERAGDGWRVKLRAHEVGGGPEPRELAFDL